MLQPRFAVLALSMLVLAGCGDDAQETAAEPTNQNQYATQESFTTLEQTVAEGRTAFNNLENQVRGVANTQTTQGQQVTRVEGRMDGIDTKLTNFDTRLTNIDTRTTLDTADLRQQIEELKAHTSQPYGGTPAGSTGGGTPTTTAPAASAQPSSDPTPPTSPSTAPNLFSWGQAAATTASSLEQVNRAADQAITLFKKIDEFRDGGESTEVKERLKKIQDDVDQHRKNFSKSQMEEAKRWKQLKDENKRRMREKLEKKEKSLWTPSPSRYRQSPYTEDRHIAKGRHWRFSNE